MTCASSVGRVARPRGCGWGNGSSGWRSRDCGRDRDMSPHFLAWTGSRGHISMRLYQASTRQAAQRPAHTQKVSPKCPEGTRERPNSTKRSPTAHLWPSDATVPSTVIAGPPDPPAAGRVQLEQLDNHALSHLSALRGRRGLAACTRWSGRSMSSPCAWRPSKARCRGWTHPQPYHD